MRSLCLSYEMFSFATHAVRSLRVTEAEKSCEIFIFHDVILLSAFGPVQIYQASFFAIILASSSAL